MKYKCAHCGKAADKAAGHVNRARAAGLNLYCNRRCSGLGRRSGKTKAQKREEKRLYDIVYRAKNREKRKAQKREYHERTYDPVKAAAYRKTRMPCREIDRIQDEIGKRSLAQFTASELIWFSQFVTKMHFSPKQDQLDRQLADLTKLLATIDGRCAPQ